MKNKAPIRAALLAVIGALMVANAAAQGAGETPRPTTLSETYDAWTVQCVNQADGERTRRTCRMSQELLQQGSRQRMLLFAVTKPGKDNAKATLVMPFGLLLADGVRMEIAEKELARGVYRTCLPAGCVAEIELPNAMIERLGAGEKVSVLMTANSGEPVRIDVSLAGFTAAYRRLIALAAD